MPSADDRYQVDPLDGPAAMAQTLRSLEQRVSALEGAPLSGSNLTVIDEAGTTRATLGKLASGLYGLELLDAVSAPVLEVDDTGFLIPAIPLQPRDANAFIIGNGATFSVTSWWAGVPLVHSNAITVSAGWITSAATTGELRIIVKSAPNTGTGVTAATSAVTLGAGTTGTQIFNWVHGLARNTGPWYFGVQSRRTGGAGDVDTYVPNYMALVGSTAVGATPTGL